MNVTSSLQHPSIVRHQSMVGRGPAEAPGNQQPASANPVMHTGKPPLTLRPGHATPHPLTRGDIPSPMDQKVMMLKRLEQFGFAEGKAEHLKMSSEQAGPPQPLASDQPYTPTLEGLLAAWGTSDQTYDLTGNGTVGLGDLLQFLQQMQPSGNSVANSITGLIEAWGTDNAEYDMTGDGKVGLADLLAMIDQLTNGNPPQESQQPPSAAPSDESSAGSSAGTADPAGRTPDEAAAPHSTASAAAVDNADLSLKGVLDAWGSDNPRYDFNRDGIVGIEELLEVLKQT